MSYIRLQLPTQPSEDTSRQDKMCKRVLYVVIAIIVCWLVAGVIFCITFFATAKTTTTEFSKLGQNFLENFDGSRSKFQQAWEADSPR